MNLELPPNQLEALLDEAFQILFVKQMGLNHAEPVFIRILDLLRTDPDAKTWFMEQMTNEVTLDCPIVPAGTMDRPKNFIDDDLICYIAHATKWDGFTKAVSIKKSTETYANKLLGNRDIADLVEDALSDNWEDRDFYQSFV